MPDEIFRWLIILSAISVFAIVVLVVWELVDKSRLSLHQFGLHGVGATIREFLVFGIYSIDRL